MKHTTVLVGVHFKHPWKFSIITEMCCKCKHTANFKDLVWKKDCELSY